MKVILQHIALSCSRFLRFCQHSEIRDERAGGLRQRLDAKQSRKEHDYECQPRGLLPGYNLNVICDQISCSKARYVSVGHLSVPLSSSATDDRPFFLVFDTMQPRSANVSRTAWGFSGGQLELLWALVCPSLLLRFGEFVADSARHRYFSRVVPGRLLGHLSRGLASQERLAQISGSLTSLNQTAR